MFSNFPNCLFYVYVYLLEECVNEIHSFTFYYFLGIVQQVKKGFESGIKVSRYAIVAYASVKLGAYHCNLHPSTDRGRKRKNYFTECS